MPIRGHIHDVEIPHDPGNYLALRDLGWQQLEQARSAGKRRMLAEVRDMGADVFAALRDPAQTQQAQQAEIDPLSSVDLKLLLELGVTGWRGPAYDSTPFSIDALAWLDEQTAQWAARVLLGIEAGVKPDSFR